MILTDEGQWVMRNEHCWAEIGLMQSENRTTKPFLDNAEGLRSRIGSPIETLFGIL